MSGELNTKTTHPNRELPQSVQTRAAVIALLLMSAGLVAVLTVGGWSVLEGAQFVQTAYLLFFVCAAVLIAKWNRGVLPVVSSMALVLIIVAAVAAPGWFARSSAGFQQPLLPTELLGFLTLCLIPLQIVVIVYSLRGFGQGWNVEE